MRVGGMRLALTLFALSLSLLGMLRADPLPALGRGINLGNFLESPHEGDWGQKLTEDDFAIIKKAGFITIRVPICWSAHVASAAPFAIDPNFMSRIDWVVQQAKKNGLNAILDYHNDDVLMRDPDSQADRFVSTWQQIANHFQNEPDTILFELLNEPKDKLDAPKWNQLVERTLAVIRPTNPTRAVVVGPVRWNNSGMLPELVLPESDQHLIVTIHYYDPMTFTHQGASWVPGSDKWLGNTWDGTDAQKKPVVDTFDRAQAWGRQHGRPIFLGEFGTFSKGDMASRVRWTTFVARTAEAHGFAWAYWEFSSGFGAYDPVAHQWRTPLLNALLPGT
jgi:endoglucanase